MNKIQRYVVLTSCTLSIIAWIAYLKLDAPIHQTGFYGMVLLTLWIAPLLFYVSFQPTRTVAFKDTFLGSWYFYPLGALMVPLLIALREGSFKLPTSLSDINYAVLIAIIPAIFALLKTPRQSGKDA